VFYAERRASPRLESSVFMQYGPHREHSAWDIRLKKIKDFEQPAFCEMLERASEAFSADFGYIHRTTETEMPRGLANGTMGFLDTAKTEKSFLVPSHVLLKFVPNIYWMTVFGRPYVRLFSRERLLSCPAHRTKELENGSIVVQLTPDLKDTIAEEAAFERVRQDVRDHLGNDAFFDPVKGLDYQYRVPEFSWGPILH
jgi:hypothetical protein